MASKAYEFFFWPVSVFTSFAWHSTKSVYWNHGQLAYAFSTYNAVIIGVGHESKVLAIDFMPLLLSGMIFTFNRKYWLGLAITTLGAYLEIAVNHFQINFYFLLIAGAVTIAYLVDWIQKKDWKHIIMAAGIVMVGALIGIGASAVNLLHLV